MITAVMVYFFLIAQVQGANFKCRPQGVTTKPARCSPLFLFFLFFFMDVLI